MLLYHKKMEQKRMFTHFAGCASVIHATQRQTTSLPTERLQKTLSRVEVYVQDGSIWLLSGTAMRFGSNTLAFILRSLALVIPVRFQVQQGLHFQAKKTLPEPLSFLLWPVLLFLCIRKRRLKRSPFHRASRRRY